MTPEGKEIETYDTAGELLLKSPSIVLGYYGNEKADGETFVGEGEDGRWLRTGDEAMVRKSPNGPDGNEHVWIIDRIKELIKVKVRLAIPFHIYIV